MLTLKSNQEVRNRDKNIKTILTLILNSLFDPTWRNYNKNI